MKKKELFQQIGRLPDDTEITLAYGEDFDVVKIYRNGVTKVIFDKCVTPAPIRASGCRCDCEGMPEEKLEEKLEKVEEIEENGN
jgi:hypothetical protein